MFNFGGLYRIMERDKGSRKAVKVDRKKIICSELASAIKKVNNAAINNMPHLPQYGRGGGFDHMCN